MKRILLILFLLAIIFLQGRAQRVLKATAVLDGFYTLPFEDMLDTLANKANIRFIYDKQMISPLQVTEQFNNDSVKDILALLCKANNLHYWVESEQAIYLIRSTEDLPVLKKMMHEKNTNLAYAPKELTKSQNNNSSIVVQRQVVIEKPTEIKTFEPFTLSGRIIDQVSGESLPSAVVRVANSNINTTTNADGYFTLFKVPVDTCKLLINYVGYVPETYYLNSENIKKPITIGLFTAIKSLSEVTITGKKGESLMNLDKRKISVLQFSPSKLDELPNVGERDILRSFQLMPGISASNESSSGAYVRGGTPDQNLVLFDGFTVYQVDHLYGFFSAFNANSVKDVTMYKGGFSAKFGGRLSSVTDIVGKEGNSNETNIGGDISLLSANLYYERPLNKKSSILLTYRRSYEGPLYNKIFNKFNSSTTISAGNGAAGMGARPGGGPGGGGGFEQNVSTPASAFYDLNAKYTYAPDDKNRFSWSLYQGDDDLDNSRTIELPSFISTNGGGITNTDKTNYGNLGSSLKWSRRWNAQTYSNTLLSFSTYYSERDNSNLITLTDTAGTETETRVGTFEKNKLGDFSLKSDWETQIKGNTKFLYGGFASYQDVTYDYSESDTSSLIDQRAKAFIGGGYAELELNPLEKLQIKPGIRATFYSQTNKPYFEPRLSASYLLTDKLTLKSSTGRFYQFTNRVVREDILSGSRDFWVLANGSSIPVSNANHFIFGASYETDKFLFDVEGYYKKLGNLTEYSQRIVGDRRRGGGTLEEHFYTGSGYTRGIEFLVQKTKGRYTGWISYTLSEAINNFDAYGGEFPGSHDTGHEFKAVNLYRYGRWSFAATWIFATGKPYTAPLSTYSIDNYSGNRRTFLVISDKNSLRLPSYHRLDLSATYDLIKIDSRKVGSIGFSVFNAYNRSNNWYQQYYVVNNQVITSNVNYLGLTPNLTLSIKWK